MNLIFASRLKTSHIERYKYHFFKKLHHNPKTGYDHDSSTNKYRYCVSGEKRNYYLSFHQLIWSMLLVGF